MPAGGGPDALCPKADTVTCDPARSSMCVLGDLSPAGIQATFHERFAPFFFLPDTVVCVESVAATPRRYPGEESTGHVVTEAVVVKALENVTWIRCAPDQTARHLPLLPVAGPTPATGSATPRLNLPHTSLG